MTIPIENTSLINPKIKNKQLLIFGLFFSIVFAVTNITLQSQDQDDYVKNELIIKFSNESVNRIQFQQDQLLLGYKSVDSLNKLFQVKRIKITGNRKKGDAYLIQFEKDQDINILIESYMRTGLFEFAEPNFIGEGGGREELIQASPDDQHFSRQYGLYNDGSFEPLPVKEDADIDMELAWDIEQGSPNIIVAVLDAGTKLGHPEFAGRIWNNPNESGTGTDSDNNGYIDDILGWDFVNDDNDPTDDHGHGTNVAGIACANGNNGIGYSGVDWNCKLMTCKILNQNNSGQYNWWVDAIYYAVDNGADVLNMSVGGSSFSQLFEEAVEYAYNNGVIIVACMMNTNNNVTYYPAGFQSTIAVGATNPDDTRAAPFTWSKTSGSNYGHHIDVVAPGNYIYGLKFNSDTNYDSYWGGTSQATPLVTGLCALLLAQNPTRTPDEIREIIRSTAEDQTGKLAEDKPGFDIYYGYGRINAHEALKQTGTSVATENLSLSNVSIFPNPANEYINIEYYFSEPGEVQISLIDILGRKIVNFPSKNMHKGNHNEGIEIPDLKSGIYYVSIKSNSVLILKKVLITN